MSVKLEVIYLANVVLYLQSTTAKSLTDIINFKCVSKNCQEATLVIKKYTSINYSKKEKWRSITDTRSQIISDKIWDIFPNIQTVECINEEAFRNPQIVKNSKVININFLRQMDINLDENIFTFVREATFEIDSTLFCKYTIDLFPNLQKLSLYYITTETEKNSGISKSKNDKLSKYFELFFTNLKRVRLYNLVIQSPYFEGLQILKNSECIDVINIVLTNIRSKELLNKIKLLEKFAHVYMNCLTCLKYDEHYRGEKELKFNDMLSKITKWNCFSDSPIIEEIDLSNCNGLEELFGNGDRIKINYGNLTSLKTISDIYDCDKIPSSVTKLCCRNFKSLKYKLKSIQNLKEVNIIFTPKMNIERFLGSKSIKLEKLIVSYHSCDGNLDNVLSQFLSLKNFNHIDKLVFRLSCDNSTFNPKDLKKIGQIATIEKMYFFESKSYSDDYIYYDWEKEENVEERKRTKSLASIQISGNYFESEMKEMYNLNDIAKYTIYNPRQDVSIKFAKHSSVKIIKIETSDIIDNPIDFRGFDVVEELYIIGDIQGVFLPKKINKLTLKTITEFLNSNIEEIEINEVILENFNNQFNCPLPENILVNKLSYLISIHNDPIDFVIPTSIKVLKINADFPHINERIKKLQSLEQLSFSNNSSQTNDICLSYMTKLTRFEGNKCNVILPKTIQELNISNVELSSEEDLPFLETLKITDFSMSSDFRQLQTLKKLYLFGKSDNYPECFIPSQLVELRVEGKIKIIETIEEMNTSLTKVVISKGFVDPTHWSSLKEFYCTEAMIQVPFTCEKLLLHRNNIFFCNDQYGSPIMIEQKESEPCNLNFINGLKWLCLTSEGKYELPQYLDKLTLKNNVTLIPNETKKCKINKLIIDGSDFIDMPQYIEPNSIYVKSRESQITIHSSLKHLNEVIVSDKSLVDLSTVLNCKIDLLYHPSISLFTSIGNNFRERRVIKNWNNKSQKEIDSIKDLHCFAPITFDLKQYTSLKRLVGFMSPNIQLPTQLKELCLGLDCNDYDKEFKELEGITSLTSLTLILNKPINKSYWILHLNNFTHLKELALFKFSFPGIFKNAKRFNVALPSHLDHLIINGNLGFVNDNCEIDTLTMFDIDEMNLNKKKLKNVKNKEIVKMTDFCQNHSEVYLTYRNLFEYMLAMDKLQNEELSYLRTSIVSFRNENFLNQFKHVFEDVVIEYNNETDETKASDKNKTNEMKEMIEEENVPKTTLEKLEEMRRQRDSGMNEIENNTNNNDDISNDLSMEDKNESD